MHICLRWTHLLALSVLAVSCSWADSWPQWRGPSRTGHVDPGVKTPAQLAAEPKVVWRKKVGDGLASPVVNRDKLVYLDNQDGKETVHAVVATTGESLWSAPLDNAFRDTQSPAGPRSTALISSGHVYAQSCRGELQCLNLVNGEIVWRTNFTNFGSVFIGEQGKAAGAVRHGFNGAPLVEGTNLIALVGSTNGAGVVAFNKLNGTVLWQAASEPAGYSSPIVATLGARRQVVAFMAESLIGVAMDDGSPLWRVPFKTSLGRHVTTPVVVGDSVYVASHEIGLVAVRLTADGADFKAQVTWTNKEAAFNFASPVAVGQHLYGVGPRKNLVCLDTTNGKIAWSKDDFTTSAPSKAHAAFIVMGDKILTLTDGGELLLMAADNVAYREIGRTQVCGNNWCSPAYAAGKLYLRDARELLCVELLP